MPKYTNEQMNDYICNSWINSKQQGKYSKLEMYYLFKNIDKNLEKLLTLINK